MKVVNADGIFLYDENGKRYLNLAESTNVLGHRNPEVLRIISEYLRNGFVHYPLTISFPEIAERVIRNMSEVADMEGATGIFSSSGSEACDIAQTIMSDLGPVITLEGGFHGKTGMFLKKKRFDGLQYGYDFEIPFPYSDSALGNIEGAISKGAKSILLEPFQVEGGIRTVYRKFLKDIRKNFPELIICVDECYTGFGKTGKFFSYQWFDVIPDILVVGKAIGGGLPLGLTMVSRQLKEETSVLTTFKKRAFGSSAGNILSLHLADFLISMISDRRFLNQIIEKGDLFEKITGSKLKKKMRGIGLIRGIKFDKKDDAIRFSERLIRNGILATVMKDTLRLSPPLSIDKQTLTDAILKIESLLE